MIADKKPSILIVEDELIVAHDLRTRLEQLGYSVCALASSAGAAVSAAREHQPDAIIMDIQLAGGGDGVAAAEEIRQHHDVPVIYLTAHSDSTTVRRATGTSPAGYVLKPFMDRDLEIQIELSIFKHRAEVRLKEQREWLQVTLRSIADAVIATDNDDRILFVNPAAEAATGWPEQEAQGKLIGDVCHPSAESGIGEEEPPAGDYRKLRARDGVERTVEQKISPILDAHEERIGTVYVFRDVTEKQENERKLRHNQRLLGKAQEIARLGSWEHDLASGEITWSDEVFRIFGLQPGEITPSYAAFMEFVHPDDRSKVDTEYGRSLRNEIDDYDIEHRIIRSDGVVRHLREKCEHYRDGSGRVVRSVGMAHDITDQKHARLALERSNRDLEQFASIISHDLQSPLLSVDNLLTLFRRRCKDQLAGENAEIIDRAARSVGHLRSLIGDLLDFSRLSGGETAFEMTDLGEIAEEVVTDLEPMISERNGIVTVRQLPVLPVRRTQIKQLLQNLIVNGLKYNDSLTPTVTISSRVQPDSHLFAVEDNGIGIEAEFYKTIFEMFRRLHSDREYPGTGVGLASCKKIVEAHGGSIWLDSWPGRGTTIFFTLPLNW